VFDVAAGVALVHGKGVLSVRRGGRTRTFDAGTVMSLAELDGMLRGADVQPTASRAADADASDDASAEPRAEAATSLREEADRARRAFDAALARRDLPGAVSVVLGLEAAITAWRADTLQSDDVDEARRVLRAFVVRLGELATDGVSDPRERIGPYVDLLLDLRTSARDARDFATSDLVRDRLGDLGVEVRDTPGGSTWDLDDM
jgi:cysteinyl-tRNA synthetase